MTSGLQSTLPAVLPDLGDTVTLRDGRVGVIGSALLANPLVDDSYADMIVQWTNDGRVTWRMVQPGELEPDGAHRWRQSK